MKKKSLRLFVSGVCVMLLMTGCGRGTEASSSAQETALEANSAAQTTEKATEPTTPESVEQTISVDKEEQGKENEVTDSLGRTVVIPNNPKRILALNSAAMEALFDLGITPVGKVESYKIREEGIALPSVGTPSEVNVEAVCQLEPDLIFAHSRFHSGHIEELEMSGAVVYCFNPDDIDSTLTMHLGKVLGKEEAARKYDAEYEQLCARLREEVQSAEVIRTGIIIQNSDTIKAAQTASGYGALLKGLGIKNIVPDDLPNASKSSFLDFDLETIIEADPDLILVVSVTGGGQGAGKGIGQGGPQDTDAIMEKYTEDPQWAGMKAVQNGRLIVLPGSVNPNKSGPSDRIRITAETILKAIRE